LLPCKNKTTSGSGLVRNPEARPLSNDVQVFIPMTKLILWTEPRCFYYFVRVFEGWGGGNSRPSHSAVSLAGGSDFSSFLMGKIATGYQDAFKIRWLRLKMLAQLKFGEVVN